MVVILFFAAKCKLGTFIQLVSVSFPWDVHHNEIFPTVFKFCSDSTVVGFFIEVLYVIIHTHIAIIRSLSSRCDIVIAISHASKDTACVYSGSANG